jgi:FtsH-binding integral membrane protein
MAALTADVRALAGRAKTIGLIASSATALLVGLAAFRRKKSASAGGKPSWLPTILEGAGLVSSLWLAFRPQPRNRDGG